MMILANFDRWLRGLVISAAFVFLAVRLSRKRTNRNLPSPVPGLPLLGNALQMGSLTHLQLDGWKNQYGPIYSLNSMGNIVVVIASAAMASDVLDKMSAMASSRPDLIMMETMSRGNFFLMHKYDEKWRKHRRGAHEALHSPDDFFPVQEHEALLLVHHLASEELADRRVEDKLLRLSASTLWGTMYGGPPLKMSGEKNLEEINELLDRIADVSITGGGVADLIPALNYLPTCLAPFKQYANRYFARANTFFLRLADEAIQRKLVFNDPSKFNLCALLNDQKNARGLSEEDIAWICGALLYTSSSLYYFILAMIVNPHAARRAREELDTEVGERPPKIADRDHLPYIEAIVKEVLCWRPVAAMGVPHVVTEDFTYRGYTIPKGATVLGNLWSITHDPALFDDPDEFRPERFLASADSSSRQKNVRYEDLGFGYGRRICIGRHIATSTLFITIATLLWAFEFEKAIDDHGNKITPPTMEFVSVKGVICSKSFPFKLKLRSAKVLERVRAML